jgi:AraC family transcriptional regulator
LSDLANLDYLRRVNRAIDHVLVHLNEPLPLEVVAKVANFSPFHFHRIFKVVVGETLHDFVTRLRLERALTLLSRPEPPNLTEVALECGFASSSDFSRSFKAHYGVPPSRFELPAYREERRAQLSAVIPGGHLRSRLPAGANPDGFVAQVRALPPRRVAYVRVFRPYEGNGAMEAIDRLLRWAEPLGLADGQWLGYQWDDPEVVPLEQCRYDVGLEVPATATLGEGLQDLLFPAMQVAELELRGDAGLELRALDWLYTTWLPSSGFSPDHQPCFEAWIGRPFAHGTAHFELRLHLPVVRTSPE